jgi:D-glycero-D-manno-heptose 1,7-bisphosphate phosphatase
VMVTIGQIDKAIWFSEVKGYPYGKPALFLDRDGVIVEEVNYLHRVEDVRLASGAIDFIRYANDVDLAVIVVTNQAGIARNIFTLDDYRLIERKIDSLLEPYGCLINATVACPFHPDFSEGYGDRHAWWRKPGPGMIQMASERFRLNQHRSMLIGDNISDILAAKQAGLSDAIHLLTGHGKTYRDQALSESTGTFMVKACDDLLEALETIRVKYPAICED